MPTRTLRRTVTALLAALGLLGGGAVAGAVVIDDFMRPADVDNPIAHRGCVIRFDERTPAGFTVPRIHANATHMCVGVDDVYAEFTGDSATAGDLIIVTDDPGAIVDIQITEDETMTARGISCGPSGGGAETRIRCYDRDGNKVKAYSAAMYGALANLWVGMNIWVGE